MSFEKSNFSTKQVQWTRSKIFSEKRFNTIFIPLLFAFKCPRDSSFIVFVKSQNTLHNFSLSLILFVFLSLSLLLTHAPILFVSIYLSLSLTHEHTHFICIYRHSLPSSLFQTHTHFIFVSIFCLPLSVLSLYFSFCS